MKAWTAILVLLCAALPAYSVVTVNASLSDVGQNLPKTAFLRFELENCGDNIPQVPNNLLAIVLPKIDLRPVNGVISGSVLGNNEILCGGVPSTFYHITLFKDANTPTGGDANYLLSSLTPIFNPANAQPMAGQPVPPGFQVIFSNPVNNQSVTQPQGTKFSFFGTFDFTGANVVGLNTGSSVYVNGTQVSSPNFNATLPAAQANFINCSWQADLAFNVSVECPYGSGSSVFAPGSGSTIYAPQISPTFTGHVTVPAPSSATDAATKAYADSLLSGGSNATQIQGVTVSGTAPTDTQALVYNLGANRWQPTTISSSSNATQLQGTNVSASGPTSAQILQYNSGASQWQPTTLIGLPWDTAAGKLYSLSGPENITPVLLPGAGLQKLYFKAGVGVCSIDNAGITYCTGGIPGGTTGQIPVLSNTGQWSFVTGFFYDTVGGVFHIPNQMSADFNGPWTLEGAYPSVTPMANAGAGKSKIGFDLVGVLKVSENATAPLEVLKRGKVLGSDMILDSLGCFYLAVAQDLGLCHINTGVFGISNGLNPTKFNAYQSYTSSTIWSAITMGFNVASNEYQIEGAHGSGSGTYFPLAFLTNGTRQWGISLTGSFFPVQTGLAIGSAGNFVDSLWLKTNLINSGAYNSTNLNEGVTGTRINQIAKFDNAHSPPLTIINSATGDTTGFLGIVEAETTGGSCGNGSNCLTGSAEIVTSGVGQCIFDNALVVKDWVVPAPAANNHCWDSGIPAASPKPQDTKVIGVTMETNAAPGTTPQNVWVAQSDPSGYNLILGVSTATAASAFAQASTTYTLSPALPAIAVGHTAFTCTGGDIASGFPIVVNVDNVSAGSIHVHVMATTAAAASFTSIYCHVAIKSGN